MKLFKNGGNFAKSEVDTFKTRIKKLDVKLSRFDTFQITTIDQMLPEKIEKGLLYDHDRDQNRC